MTDKQHMRRLLYNELKSAIKFIAIVVCLMLLWFWFWSFK